MALDTPEARLHQFCEQIAAGTTVTAATAAVGWSRQTAYRKLRDPMVRAQIAEMSAEKWKPIFARILAELPAAVEALIALVREPSTPANTRIKATAELVKLALRLDADQFTRLRLAALEAAAVEPADTEEPADVA